MSEEAVLLKKLGEALSSPSATENKSIGKDMHLMMQEFTKNENVYRFGNFKKRDIVEFAFDLAVSDSRKNYYLVMQKAKDENNEAILRQYNRPRYYLFDAFCYYRGILSQAVDGFMVEQVVTFGGYMLAFRGGVEWRQAGIAGNDAMMDEQKNSTLLERMKR